MDDRAGIVGRAITKIKITGLVTPAVLTLFIQ